MFFYCAHFAFANLEITEVMYDPQGANTSHQWIEVYNSGPNSIDLSTWSVTDHDTSWHFRTISSDSSTSLSPNSWAIIAKTSNLTDFKNKNQNLSGQILKANITLGASSGEIGLSSDKKNIISEVSYFSLMDNGNSLQLINGEWVESTPTPGKENVLNIDEETTAGDTANIYDNSDITSTDEVTSNEKLTVLKITTKIISPKIVIAGTPFSLSSLTTTNRSETYTVGNYVWNFGDGMVSKIYTSGPFDYMYEYPGEYSVTLSYFDSIFNKIADSTNKFVIKVVPSEIFVSAVGNTDDPFIEIENKSKYEITLSNWIVTAGSHYFIIPVGTIILSGKKIKLSPKITGFVGKDLQSVIITNQDKLIISNYPAEMKNLILKKSIVSVASNNKTVPTNNSLPDDQSLVKDSQIINLNNLGASVQSSGFSVPKKAYPIIGLFAIIGIGGASFLLLKKKGDSPDYIDKEISAKDIKIVK